MIRYKDNGEREESFRKPNSLVCVNHIHPMAEIVFVVNGYVVASINGKPQRAEKGDIIVSLPNTIHGYSEQSPVSELRAFIMVANIEDYPNCKALSLIESPIIKNALSPEFLALISSSHTIYNKSKVASDVRHNVVSLLLSYLLTKCRFSNNAGISSKVDLNIYNYCNQNFNRNISVEEVAEKLNMSRSSLSRIFSKKFNMSFPDYINMLRISSAKIQLVSTDKPVSLIAEECGFGTVRTFNRVFIKTLGVTPREYRKTDVNKIEK